MPDKENLLDIPPQFDRRPNGRCRSFWWAHDHAPGNVNPYHFAEENWHKFLDKALKMDEKQGLIPACKPLLSEKTLKPIRQRSRNK